MILTITDINELKIDRLLLKIDKIERKIERTFERIHYSTICGKQTEAYEEYIDKLLFALNMLEKQHERFEILNPEELIDEEILSVSDLFTYWENEYEVSSRYENIVSVHTEIGDYYGSSNANLSNDNDQQHISEENTSKNDLDLDWLSRNEKIGELGEKIALHYLNDHISHQIKSVSQQAYKGYDLEWKQSDQITIGYEIKTSNCYSGFHITRNELEKASSMKNNYNIFIININPDFEYVEGFIINNPIEVLNINLEEITQPSATKCGLIKPTQFTFTFLPSFIENMEKYKLIKTEFINEVLQLK